MATVLQHQVESRVNDLYRKLGAHAHLIMRLSVELDRIRQENDEMKEIIREDRTTLKRLSGEVELTSEALRRSAEPGTVPAKKKTSLDDISTRPETDNTITDEFAEYCNTTK